MYRSTNMIYVPYLLPIHISEVAFWRKPNPCHVTLSDDVNFITLDVSNFFNHNYCAFMHVTVNKDGVCMNQQNLRKQGCTVITLPRTLALRRVQGRGSLRLSATTPLLGFERTVRSYNLPDARQPSSPAVKVGRAPRRRHGENVRLLIQATADRRQWCG